jgi:hypothetical protein
MLDCLAFLALGSSTGPSRAKARRSEILVAVLYWIRRKKGISRSRLYLSMPEQLADHRQPFADEQSTGRERMAKIVDAYVSEACRLADALPRMLKGSVR